MDIHVAGEVCVQPRGRGGHGRNSGVVEDVVEYEGHICHSQIQRVIYPIEIATC